MTGDPSTPPREADGARDDAPSGAILPEDGEPTPELLHLASIMVEALDRVGDLGPCLEALDELLVTGRPLAIAEAATAVELSLAASEPLFRDIGRTLDSLGLVRLQEAAERLRHARLATAGDAAASLSLVLQRFARRNGAHTRRAQSLSRGLSASLRTLHALGMAGSGRLLAEA